jgi:hypothetical protein
MGIPTTKPEDLRYVPPLGRRPLPEGTLLGGPPPAPPTYYDPEPGVAQAPDPRPAAARSTGGRATSVVVEPLPGTGHHDAAAIEAGRIAPPKAPSAGPIESFVGLDNGQRHLERLHELDRRKAAGERLGVVEEQYLRRNRALLDNHVLKDRDPAKFHLRFDGRFLRLYNGQEIVAEWPGVSGRENFGSGKDQDKRNYGPIPEGTYDIKQDRYQAIDLPRAVYGASVLVGNEDAGAWPGSLYSWGSERVWADPTPETERSGLTFGRKDMAIHGGWKPGSAGCIDLTGSMASFARAFRTIGRDLKLYVDYSPPQP